MIPAPAMSRNPDTLERQRFDVLIVGGGINGAGLARDLALRGLQVALVDKGDFACGTSSASTKLIHGGLRYLENFDFGLVFEACRERQVLQRIAPHLVRPLRFYIPVYRGDRRPFWMIRAGMVLYDLLALMRNTGHHSVLTPRRALAREPALIADGLRGVAAYWDCAMDDARLCLENVIAAAEAGATVANYMRLAGFSMKDGRIVGAELIDEESGREFGVEAEIVVNMTGPWLDQVRAMAGDHEPMLRTTRGAHILVPRINRGDEAIYLSTAEDNRLFFVIPWGELSLVGTTDTDTDQPPEEAVATDEDIDYLLAATRRHLHGTELSRDSIVSTFAGLRPLVADTRDTASNVSREHRVFESASGLFSVGGGKYTTYRAVAEEVAGRIVSRLGRGRGESRTANLGLPGGVDFTNIGKRLSEKSTLSAGMVERLFGRYGARATELVALAEAEPRLTEPIVTGSELTWLEVDYAVCCEQARTPEDVLRRRTDVALKPGRGLAELEAIAERMQQLLAVDEDTKQQWKWEYEARYSHIGRS
ncbi:MAG: glycerol-3-phosphate dehydrogenase [Desulfuromonas sp.]|nr:MAG: glycerol-3-phosphate dehydrogenase [Desulfuromonas sp.]